MADNAHYPVLRPCLCTFNVVLCLVGVVGALSVFQSLNEIQALSQMNASGSEYLPYYLFFPVEAAMALALPIGVVGCLAVFGRLCLIPSCVLGGVWSALAIIIAVRFLPSYLMSPDAWTSPYLFYTLILLALFAVPLLWAAMTITFVRRVRKEQRERSQLTNCEHPELPLECNEL